MLLPPALLARVLEAWPVATLTTMGAQLHSVPDVFVADGDDLVLPVDGKPKTARGQVSLQREHDLERNPACVMLLQNYSDDWDALWWLRLNGNASLTRGNDVLAERLIDKYPQYVDLPFDPDWRAIRFVPESHRAWALAGGEAFASRFPASPFAGTFG